MFCRGIDMHDGGSASVGGGWSGRVQYGARCTHHMETVPMATHFDFTEYPHRRYNALTGEYVLVSPHRTKRPWQGDRSKPDVSVRPEYDPKCYLCPGNTRAGAFPGNVVNSPSFSGNVNSAPLSNTQKW